MPPCLQPLLLFCTSSLMPIGTLITRPFQLYTCPYAQAAQILMSMQVNPSTPPTTPMSAAWAQIHLGHWACHYCCQLSNMPWEGLLWLSHADYCTRSMAQLSGTVLVLSLVLLLAYDTRSGIKPSVCHAVAITSTHLAHDAATVLGR